MAAEREEREILRIIEDYAGAWETGEPERFARLFWTEDPSFSVVENDRPYPLGAEYIEMLVGEIRKSGPGPSNQRFHDTTVYRVTPETAYSVSLRDELNTQMTSRVTFVYQKKGEEWRIIHGHFSFVPE